MSGTIGALKDRRESLAHRLRPLVALARPYRWLTVATIASGMTHQLTKLAVAATGAWLVGQAVTGAAASDLTGALALLAALMAPLVAAPWLESYLAHLIAFRLLAGLRGRVYAALERLAPGYLLERRSGDLGATAIADVEQTEIFFAHTLSPLVVACTVPVAALAALTWFHPALAFVLMPSLAVLATIPSWLRERAAEQGDEVRGRLGEVNAEVVDTIQGMREVLSFGAAARQRARLAERERLLLRASVAHGRRSSLEASATDAVSIAGLLAVLVTAAILVVGGRLDPALYPVAVILAATTFSPVIAVTDVARDLNLVATAADRVQALLSQPAPVTDRAAVAPSGPVAPVVSFDAVRFRYAPALPDVLDAVTFTVREGETVALVGHSGAGKSTCAHLLLRLWDVTGGQITIGGHDLRDFPQEELRRLLTFVPQDVYLFNVPLRDNIRLGRHDATDAEVEAAARTAQAHDFISGLPDGYDTVTGEFGAQLSGGQRQRIAIARALLKDAPILIMDEAVSNLDATSEKELAKAMERARKGRTTLVIAHRLSTIRAADRIVALDHGRVAETGTHRALLAAGGVYTRLVRTQALERTAGDGGSGTC